jgi:hypothetical protein
MTIVDNDWRSPSGLIYDKTVPSVTNRNTFKITHSTPVDLGIDSFSNSEPELAFKLY